jgi:NTP pyrophosphatase (non-canonical NTP hydrolase)
MDNKVTIQELKNDVAGFINARGWDVCHKPKDIAMTIGAEAGELLQIFRFKSDAECAELFNKPERREHICEEIADILYGVLDFATMNGIDLSTALKTKIAKNNAKYPVETCKGDHRKYNEK